MGKRKAFWDKTPESLLYPSDYYDLKITAFEEGHTQTDSLLSYTATCEIVKPKAQRGGIVFLRFVLGTKDDPTASDPQTWAGRNFTKLVSFLKACGVKADGHPGDIAEAGTLVGKMLTDKMGQWTPKNEDGTLADPAQTHKFHPLGDHEAGSLQKEAGGTKPKPKVVAPAEPDEDDDDEDEEEEEAPKAKKAKAAEAAPAKKKKRPPVEEDDEDEDDED